MSVRKKGNRWEVRIRVGSGQRIERTLPVGASKADALAFEAKIRREQIDTEVGRRRRYLIDQALDKWESEARHLKSYEGSLKYRISVLRDWTKGKPLSELPSVAEQFKQAARKESLSPAAINRYLAILRRIGNLAVRWEWTDQPLGARIEMVPGERQRHVYLTPQQVQALAKEAGGEAGDLILFASLTGLRRSEILSLQPDNIKDACILLGSNTKSGKPRLVPMPPVAARIAKKRLPWAIDAGIVRREFERARAALGLSVNFHDLRHTYASWLVQNGQSMTAVRDLLGHSSLAVTSRYSHLAPEHLRTAVNALPAFGGRGKGGGKKLA